MTDSTYTCPQSREQVIGTYFLEHRAKLLDVAAFLDRLDRARPGMADKDMREIALLRAIQILNDGQPQRTARILGLFSDHSTELSQSAEGMKGALGAARLPSDSE